MRKLFLSLLFPVLLFNCASVEAVEHPAGHGGAGNKGRAGTCARPRLEKFLPVNMATVAPGSEFSFVVFNIESPEQLIVTAKKMPVQVHSEFKDPFYVITGKLPDELRDTVARINVKVDAKVASCEAESGWLVKISE